MNSVLHGALISFFPRYETKAFWSNIEWAWESDTGKRIIYLSIIWHIITEFTNKTDLVCLNSLLFLLCFRIIFLLKHICGFFRGVISILQSGLRNFFSHGLLIQKEWIKSKKKTPVKFISKHGINECPRNLSRGNVLNTFVSTFSTGQQSFKMIIY